MRPNHPAVNIHASLLVTTLYLTSHTPIANAAFASSDADATLGLLNPAPPGLTIVDSSNDSKSSWVIGDGIALSDASAEVLPLSLSLLSSASADALFPPSSTASASALNSGSWTLSNLSVDTSFELELAFDWFYVLDAVSDFVAPVESAVGTVTIRLVDMTDGATDLLFETFASTDIGGGELFAGDSFLFSLGLAPGETRVLGFQVDTYAEATAVPLPASLLLLMPALAFVSNRRRTTS